MISHSANNSSITIRGVRRYGDGQLFSGAIKLLNPELFLKPIQYSWNVLVHLFQFNIAVSAFSTNVFYKRDFGSQSTGFGLVIFGVCFILLFNNLAVPDAIKPLIFWFWPFWKIIQGPSEFTDFAIANVHSNLLLIHALSFTVLGFIHVLYLHIAGSHKGSSKRGESWIFSALSKHINTSEYLVTGVLEPMMTLGLACILWKFYQANHYALFLTISASSVAIQNLIDVANQAEKDAILNL